MNTIITSTPLLALGGVIILLFYSEIWKSFLTRHGSEKNLGNERDVLEAKVSERTSELMASETARMIALERNARFGELSQGLFHDLMNQLQSVSLSVEKLSAHNAHKTEVSLITTKTLEASKRMKTYMESVRSCLGKISDTPIVADIQKEVGIVQDILAHKARMTGVNLEVVRCDKATVPIHSMRLHQLLLNLTANAIESFENCPKRKDPRVAISAVNSGTEITIEVTDNGSGISHENQANVFSRQFTTKKNGTGIGLMTVKRIVEEELGGSIAFESGKGGTIFRVTIENQKVE